MTVLSMTESDPTRDDAPKPPVDADVDGASAGNVETDDEVLLQSLLDKGKLTRKQVLRMLEWQQRRGVSTEVAVEQMGLVRREDMLKALSQRYSYPIIDDMPDSRNFSRELVVGHEPFSPQAEAIRSIRSTIAATALAQGTRSFIVVGPNRDVGVTYLTCNLAISFAQMAIPTLLVDANLREPRAAQLFGIPRETPGLSEYLRNREGGFPPVLSEVLPNLSILPAGAIPPNPQELLSSPAFLALTDMFHERYGVVIYDTAAVHRFSDAFVVGSRVNAAILVGRRHKTGYREVSALVKKLESIRCSIIGTVFNQY
jgi:protein-tyrosine kinase